MIFKYIYKVSGQSVHVKALCGEDSKHLALSGILCYSIREWTIFMNEHMKNHKFQFEEQTVSGPEKITYTKNSHLTPSTK